MRRRCLAAIAVVGLWGCSSSEERTTFTREQLLKPETCGECHEDHYREWSGSMHAYAGEDPVFLAMNARGQRETKGELGNFCIKCHAPMAVNEGASTDGLDLAELPSELKGVTCYFCHNASSIEGTHNNPIRLSNDVTMRGNITDPVANKAHSAEYSPLLDGNDTPESSRLCGTCHDLVVSKDLSGGAEDVHLERTFKEWNESLFSVGERGRLACNKCHMPVEPGVPIANAPGVPSRPARHLHDLAGVDVALTPFPQAEAQRSAVQRLLDTTIRVEVCVSSVGTIDVSLENRSGGHNVPSGASQDRRLWVEVKGYDSPDSTTPRLIAGVPPASGDIDSSEVETPWVFRDRAFDAQDEETHMFWNVARSDPGTILAPITTRAIEPGYHREVVKKTYHWVAAATYPGLLTVTLKMTPIARAVLDDLVNSKDLDESIANEVPTFSLLPNRHLGGDVTLSWTLKEAIANGYQVQDQQCLETAPPRQ